MVTAVMLVTDLNIANLSPTSSPSEKNAFLFLTNEMNKTSLVVSLFSPRFCNSNNFLLRLNPVLLLNCIYWNCKLYHFSCVQHVIFTSEPSRN